MVEVRKKLIGDSGDTLITPFRVCILTLLVVLILYIIVCSSHLISSFVLVCTETFERGRATQVLKKRETASNVFFGELYSYNYVPYKCTVSKMKSIIICYI